MLIMIIGVATNTCKGDVFYGSRSDLRNLAQGESNVPISDFLDLVDIENYNKY